MRPELIASAPGSARQARWADPLHTPLLLGSAPTTLSTGPEAEVSARGQSRDRRQS
jgi:hypothetical protein